MARTDVGATLTREHRNRQMALRARTLDEFRLLWPIWQGTDAKTFDRLVAATVPLVQMRRETSAGIAVDYYRTFRVAEQVPGTAEPRLSSQVPREQVETSLYATGKTQVRRSVTSGFSADHARRAALASMAGAVTRHVLDGSRQTIILSAAADPQARGGWRRITDGEPCAFCAMLAARGAVYSNRTARFQSHDHCGCSAEPSYPGSSMTDEAARFKRLYDQAVRDAREAGELNRGTSNDSLNAFRRLYESGRG